MATITSVAQYGFSAATLITNNSCVFGMTSGVGAINPETYIKAKVVKSDLVILPYDRLPRILRRHFESGKGAEYGKQQFFDWAKTKLDEVIESGKVFNYGDIILGLKQKGIVNKIFLKHKSFNQPYKVIGYKDTNPIASKSKAKGFKSEQLKLKVSYEMEVTSQWWKLRNDGIKFTTAPQELAFYSTESSSDQLNIKWDFFLPMESIKGRLATLIAYCYAHGGGELSLKDGGITMADGTFINLLEKDSLIYQWLQKEAVKTVWVQFQIAKAEYTAMIAARREHEDLVVISEDDTSVVLREKTQILESELVYEVEVSTPRENSGNTALTLETGASIALQSRTLAEALNKESQQSREAVKGLLEMLNNKPAGVPVVDIGKATVREALAKQVGDIQGLSDSQIIDKYKEAYPKGVVFEAISTNTSAKKGVYLNFDTIRSMSTFIGGSAEGVGEDIVTFLTYLNNPGEGGVDTKVYSKISLVYSSIKGWAISMIESKSIMKRMARLQGAKALKVRTAPWTIIHHNPGELPKIALNPNDDVVKLLCSNSTQDVFTRYCDIEGEGKRLKFVFNPDKFNGEIVTVGRAPMVMQTACEVVLTELVDVAHCVLLPSIWAPSNEGDSDGDGIVLINAGIKGVTYAEALKMNEDLMSMNGYRLVYGADSSKHPCAEFCEYATKWGKKALVWEDKAKEDKYLTPYIGEMKQADYEAYGKNVPAHYLTAVGIAYNICVVLTHKAVNLQYEIWSKQDAGEILGNLKGILDLTKMAMTVAWRSLYEGLGLGGFSPEATRFYAILRVAAFQEVFVDKEIEGKLVPSFADKNKPSQIKKDCLDALSYLGNDLDMQGGLSHLNKDNKNTLPKAIMAEIVKAVKISFNWTAIETGKDRVSKMTKLDITEAVLYGCLRRAGQGLDPSGQLSLESSDQEDSEQDEDGESVTPESLMQKAIKLTVWQYEHCPWIADVIQTATNLHVQANKIIYLANKPEDDNDNSGY
jgi:hypothetical protein